MKDCTIRTTCRLCDTPLPDERCLDLGETPLANEYMSTAAKSLAQERFPLHLKQCTACGHVQLPVVVDPKRLWGPNYPYASGTSPVFRKHLEALADEVAALKPGGRVLEIGSNDGTLCRMLYSRGMTVVGFDPSGPLEYEMASNHSLALEPYSWPTKGTRGDLTAACDVILALNVFAHVDDLQSFTAAIAEALAPDGVCIIEVGYLPTVIERGLFDTVYHEHLSYHHVKPLVPFFRRHGLGIRGYERIKSQGGSIRLYVVHQNSDPHWIFSECIEPDIDLSSLQLRIDSTREVLPAVMDCLKCWGVFGVPAKLTTLLSAVGETGLCHAYDDNELKQGKYVPGTGIIIEPAVMLVDEPEGESCLIASWNFASEIMPRLRSQGYKGKFIIPLPEVRVYG